MRPANRKRQPANQHCGRNREERERLVERDKEGEREKTRVRKRRRKEEGREIVCRDGVRKRESE